MFKTTSISDRSPTTNTVGTSYTTGGTGGTGWKSLPIPLTDAREASLILDITKGTATKLTLKLEVGRKDASADADFYERWMNDNGAARLDYIEIDTAGLGTTHRLAIPVDVVDVPALRVRMKADGAADAAVALGYVAGRE